MNKSDWAGPESLLGKFVREESTNTLEAYSKQPSLVVEQANLEQDAARGGYASRQIVELIQNSADQIAKRGSGRILIHLTGRNLYCADDGEPLTEDGARALLFSHLSPKRQTNEIGRFGVGFKSVLGVSHRPTVFSRSGSIQFDRAGARRRIALVAPDAEAYPVLRVAEPVDPTVEARSDAQLNKLMNWATNIVRLPLKSRADRELIRQIDEFQSEFLLFVKHVASLRFSYPADGRTRRSRNIQLTEDDGTLTLVDNKHRSQWTLFQRDHMLSRAAKTDSRSLDNADRVRIVWAAPRSRADRRELQQFWAYFPTQTSSLLRGVLNAPWKTNEDRQSLLPGVYNDELIDAAAQLVVDSLPLLRSESDPGHHLDYLPRREEAGDNNHAIRLRRALNQRMRGTEIVPDQDGALKRAADLSIPPGALTPAQTVNEEVLRLWSGYTHRPADWLHDEALQNQRLSAIFRIRDGGATQRGDDRRATVTEWITALVRAGRNSHDPIGASRSAILITHALPEDSPPRYRIGYRTPPPEIVYTESGEWATLDPENLVLWHEDVEDPATTVHRDLTRDPTTAAALKALGIQEPSAERTLKEIAKHMDGYFPRSFDAEDWNRFWRTARELTPTHAHKIISGVRDWRYRVRAKAMDGNWTPICFLLLPGRIVPDDGSRDRRVAVDLESHRRETELLKVLGLSDRPHPLKDAELYWGSGTLQDQRDHWEQQYYSRNDLPSRAPQRQYFTIFPPSSIPVPLEAIDRLSEDGQWAMTEELLATEETYPRWEARHNTQSGTYPRMSIESLVIALLKRHGKVKLAGGVHALSDGLGDLPKSGEVRTWLLDHPKADLIREHFDLPEQLSDSFEPIGEEEPLPIVDVWPGLVGYLCREHRALKLIRCDTLRSKYGLRSNPDAMLDRDTLYVCRTDEAAELHAVSVELGLPLTDSDEQDILSFRTPEEIEASRARVRAQATDAARLLAAVGEYELRRRLPDTLVDILQRNARPFVGEHVAEAAIAVYHTSALREYKEALAPLSPPVQWAGGRLALEFVRDLGFSDEWAGEQRQNRAPVIDVLGPRSLPDLHEYQRNAVSNVQKVLRAGRNGTGETENRGLLSLPTGSGKTRVAVQAIVEAHRAGDIDGTVLWVADRGELCEQAVEAWSQGWASFGPEGQPLRIARMWEGQRPEIRQDGAQVVIGTIQTLHRRDVAAMDIDAVVIDEAHGSIAPTYTSVLQDLGLTFRRRNDEIPLIGLTATPYRGINEEETARLAARYGQNRLDAGAFPSDDPEDVIRELQAMRVLAQADHQEIEGGTEQLNEKERQQSQRIPGRLPQSVEERLARDGKRTQAIVDAYTVHVRGIDPEWPTLIFATSVRHAETVAALLQLQGVPARAVSSETDPVARRRVVEEFRNGTVKALVNYGVFREGFDAPKTRAIIVARPVYSPNLYFQMIGRGLRGPRNGGSDRCLVIDVRDNIENYEGQLAYTDLEGLWSD